VAGLPTKTITEDVTGQIDGLATSFVVSGGPFLAGSLLVHHNGVRLLGGTLVGGDDYEEDPGLAGFEMLEAPQSADTLQVQFEVNDPDAAWLLVQASGVDPTL
jgi:hypothetical protein